MAEADEDALARPQRRLLKRVFNGRTAPLVAGGLSFRVYRDAATYLLSLPREDRDAAYETLKAAAKAED